MLFIRVVMYARCCDRYGPSIEVSIIAKVITSYAKHILPLNTLMVSVCLNFTFYSDEENSNR